MGNTYSEYVKEAQKLPPTVCVIFAVPHLFYGINLSQEIINGVHQVYLDVWKKPIERIKYYNANLVKFVPHKYIMYQGATAPNSALSKQMFSRFHKLLCTNGWSLVSSPTLTFEWSLSSWFFYKELNPYMISTGAMDNEFCAISLSGQDSFQFIDFPPHLQDSAANCVSSNWQRGIQEKVPILNTDNAWTIKLHGYPWGSYSSSEAALEARFLVLSLIRFMSHRNWRLVNSAAMKPDASDTLFFRNFSDAFNVMCPDTMPEYYFLLALMDKDQLVILGGDQNIKNVIANSCARYEKKGIKPVDMVKNYPAVILNSKVWSRRREKELKTRRLITLIFQDLASIGWLPTESIDCSRSIKDLSSILFVRIPPIRMMFFCLCPKKFNGITLVNAPDDVINIVYETFIQNYPIERHKISKKLYGLGTEIKFIGDPFRVNKFGAILFQQTLAVVIDALKNSGWILLLSADTSDETLTRQTSDDSYETIKYSIMGIWFSKVIGN